MERLRSVNLSCYHKKTSIEKENTESLEQSDHFSVYVHTYQHSAVPYIIATLQNPF